MDAKGFLSGNLVLDLSVVAWFLAQAIKVLLHLAAQRILDLRLVIRSGGMPSSHSAFVCAAASSTGMIYGWRGAAFALAAVIALVVMYDACNVRRSAGEQARVVNAMIRTGEIPGLDGNKKELKEALGHTTFQVWMGAMLGIAVGVLGTLALG